MLAWDRLDGRERWVSGFKSGQVMIQGQMFELKSRTREPRCCRVIVPEDVVIPGRSETSFPEKLLMDRVDDQESGARGSSWLLFQQRLWVVSLWPGRLCPINA